MHPESVKAFLDNALDAVVGMDEHGVIISWNAQASVIFGWRADEAIGRRMSEAIIPMHLRQAHERGLRAFLENGRDAVLNRRIEIAALRRTGEEFPVELTVTPIRIEQAWEFYAFLRDITDRKRGEAALREAKERIQAVVSNVPIVLFSLDRDGVFVLSEGKGLQVLGLQPAQVVGRSVFELYEHVPWLISSIRQALAGEAFTITGELEGVWLETHYAPLCDAEGAVIGVTGVALDITHQKQIEEEVARTNKLESIGLLAGGIAHDFNNILTTVVGNLSLAKLMVEPDSKLFRRLTESAAACLRGRDLTRQLLTFSKGGRPVRIPISIAGLLNDSACFALQGSNIRCELAIADDLWSVNADEGQLNQVVSNLMLNAQQAMPDGGTVHVTARNRTLPPNDIPSLPSGDYVAITIEDQGTGIPQEHVQKIFDPFFTTKHTGSGLGLTTSYWIIKRHDGHISVRSEPGRGTTLDIFLPRSPNPTPLQPPAQEPAIRGKGRILIMDDEPAIREFVAALLTHLGYDPESSHDAEDTVERFRKAAAAGRPFDAVILDLTIRGGRGAKEAIRKLRELDPRVKAIVVSGYVNDPALTDYRSFGFAATIDKPFSPEKLSLILNQVLTEGRPG